MCYLYPRTHDAISSVYRSCRHVCLRLPDACAVGVCVCIDHRVDLWQVLSTDPLPNAWNFAVSGHSILSIIICLHALFAPYVWFQLIVQRGKQLSEAVAPGARSKPKSDKTA